MIRIVYFFLFTFSTLNLFAQAPNDCVNAIVVCGNANFSSNASGIGNLQEVAGCGGFEHNSIWIKINIVRTGTLGFNLIPNDPTISVDYDFWVYGPNRNCNNLGAPVRCCTTNPQEAGLSSNTTGMNGNTATTTSGPGANGNGFVRWLDVIAGQSYYIAIDRPVGDGGFELQWLGSTMDAGGAFPTPPVANSISEIRTCSTTPNVGIFDLNNIRPNINSDVTNNSINFYTSLANATDGINPLPNIFANTTNPQTLFVKVKNNTSGCSTINTFTLRVMPVPDATMSVSSTTICMNDNATITFTGTPNSVVEYTVDGGAIQTGSIDNTGVFQITTPITSTKVYRLVRVKTLDSDNITTLCSKTKNITITINVSTLASPTITSNNVICYGANAIFNINGIANSTINYTIDAGINQTATLDGTGSLQINLPGLLAGTHTLIISSITDSNAPYCTNNTPISSSVIVQPQLAVNIVATNSVCSGTSGTVTFTGTPNALVTYNVDGGANQTITLNTLGTASLTTPILTTNTVYTLINVETTNAPICSLVLTDSATITTTGLPTATISGTATICSGNTSVISFSGSPGATVTYTINGGTNQTITLDAGGNASLTTPSLTTNTTYSLVSVETTCANSVIGNVTITILELPNATISTNTTICSGSSTTIQFNGSPNATVTYTIDGGSNQTILLNNLGVASLTTPILTTNSIYTLVNISSATIPTCTQPITGSCIITVHALPTVTISASTICSGNTGTVTFTGTPNGIVTYNVDGGADQTILLDAIGNAVLTTPILTTNSTYQLINVVTTSGLICSQNLTTTASVIVTALPTVSISGTSTICSGTSTIINFTGTPNATVTYNINGGVNQTIILDINGNATITTPILNNNTTYSLVNVNSACLNTVTGSANITVLSIPIASISTPRICNNTSGIVTFTGTPNGIVTYNVDGGINQTVTLNTNGIASINTPILTTNTTYNLIDITLITPDVVCSNPLFSSSTLTIIPIADVITSPNNNTICSGNTAIIPLSSSIINTSYEWYTSIISSPIGGTITGFSSDNSQTSNLISQTLYNSGTSVGIIKYNIIPFIESCPGTPIDIYISVNPTAQVNTITDEVVCNEANTTAVTFGTTNTGGTATYTWTNDNTAIGLAASSAVNVTSIPSFVATNTTTAPITGTITVTPTYTNGGVSCVGATEVFTITVNPSPTITLTSAASTTNQTICVNSPIVPIQYTFDSGATGVVVTGLPAGIGHTTNGNIVTISGTPTTTAAIFNYTITATGSLCGTPSLSGVIEVTNGILPIFAQVTPVCQGATINIPTSSNNTPPIVGVWNLISSTANDVTYEFTPNPGQCALPTTMTIVVHPLPIVTPSVTSQSFCSGGTTNINLVSDVPGSAFYWTATGTSVTGQSGSVTGSGATSINQTLILNANQVAAGQVTYTIVAEANGCLGAPVSVVVTVNPIPNVIVSPVSLTETICSGGTTNISFSGAINNTVYSWSVVSSVGVSGALNGSGAAINQTLTTTGLSQGTVVYEVTPSLNGCIGTPQRITVTVNPVPAIFGSTTHRDLCSGEPTNITVFTFNAATVFNWVVEPNGVSGASSGSATGLSIVIAQTLTTSGNTRGYVDYIITPVLTGCSGNPITVRVYVNPLPVVSLTDGTICVNAAGVPFQSYELDSGLNDVDYDFVWTFEGNIIPGATSATYTATQVGTYTVVAINSTTNCVSNVASAVVTATNPATSLTVTQSEYFSDNATLVVTVTGGNGTLLYQLDQGVLQESNMFTGVTGGLHTITVVDTQGCTYLTQEVLVIDYPKYFTPNGDGHNDTWNITGMNQPEAKLYIFDRYGKLLKQIVPSSLSDGWDGTYNNIPMPSTDYWFTIDYTENGTQKQFKAHFSLKR